MSLTFCNHRLSNLNHISLAGDPTEPLGQCFHFHLASALAWLGELDAARASVQAGLALDPSFTIRRFRQTNAWSNNPIFLAGRERTLEGMHMAGVPEG
ncbi:hypothetical protein [Bradyrhizobium arachidis]|uniref:hypothetical protein n=1 Tax=Bradyrhizobium arachidis TaxID=858423 RepID=UPI002161ADB3|nr:hypothetical protein [Bradyrhizobium arachidis]UVO26990.1 hypothetical protein KUF59_31265 [Bradyrhizobium arachidis]